MEEETVSYSVCPCKYVSCCIIAVLSGASAQYGSKLSAGYRGELAALVNNLGDGIGELGASHPVHYHGSNTDFAFVRLSSCLALKDGCQQVQVCLGYRSRYLGWRLSFCFGLGLSRRLGFCCCLSLCCCQSSFIYCLCTYNISSCTVGSFEKLPCSVSGNLYRYARGKMSSVNCLKIRTRDSWNFQSR